MPTLNKKTHRHRKLTESHKVDSGEDWRKGKSAAQRGYGHKWRVAREKYLNQNPLCVHCENDGKLILAKVVDHIIDHKGNQELFWNRENWQALCVQHHNKKTAQERKK
jgi:5-methylcytosine-specific restriction endonuclease McrA